ncbi:amidohydrolase family protein [Streptomyces albidus (ex Kaewkla and Franco 2022)]|uniref:amidohydrolase family protein n=1 Tax=Streptomyces albidus (ex Kaewkla and Franco 2022) TaxID=722709 RepID=UPI0015EE7EC7|nr:amidohydrolase family protein [Streptomyces albidus (ex Kaewkla and Franco 2022)]
MTEPASCPPPVPHPRTPRTTLPQGACDAHCHIFGPTASFPYAPERTFTPPEAPKERLQALHRQMGLQRAVIVQSACHGTDHSALLDALADGPDRYRGVAIVTPATTAEEVRRLHDAGVRGARLHFTPHLGSAPSAEEIRAVVELVRPHGWHIALHVHGEGIADHEDLARSIPLPVVIDHMARVDLAQGLDSRAVSALRRLLQTGDVWVKVSGADRLATSPPSMDDSVALARLLVSDAPERVVWGTDFPHPNTHGFMPDDGDLTDLLPEIAPREEDRRRLLVDNPARCFGFAEAAP